jgi:hypothetical protein
MMKRNPVPIRIKSNSISPDDRSSALFFDPTGACFEKNQIILLSFVFSPFRKHGQTVTQMLHLMDAWRATQGANNAANR